MTYAATEFLLPVICGLPATHQRLIPTARHLRMGAGLDNMVSYPNRHSKINDPGIPFLWRAASPPLRSSGPLLAPALLVFVPCSLLLRLPGWNTPDPLLVAGRLPEISRFPLVQLCLNVLPHGQQRISPRRSIAWNLRLEILRRSAHGLESFAKV